jgi:hypothetical protein
VAAPWQRVRRRQQARRLTLCRAPPLRRRQMVWRSQVTGTPEEDPGTSAQERAYIAAGQPVASRGRAQVRLGLGSAAGCQPPLPWLRCKRVGPGAGGPAHARSLRSTCGLLVCVARAGHSLAQAAQPAGGVGDHRVALLPQLGPLRAADVDASLLQPGEHCRDPVRRACNATRYAAAAPPRHHTPPCPRSPRLTHLPAGSPAAVAQAPCMPRSQPCSLNPNTQPLPSRSPQRPFRSWAWTWRLRACCPCCPGPPWHSPPTPRAGWRTRSSRRAGA